MKASQKGVAQHNTMCFHHIESEPRALAFVWQAVPARQGNARKSVLHCLCDKTNEAVLPGHVPTFIFHLLMRYLNTNQSSSRHMRTDVPFCENRVVNPHFL